MWIANSPHIITSALVGCEEDLTEHASVCAAEKKREPPLPSSQNCEGSLQIRQQLERVCVVRIYRQCSVHEREGFAELS